MTDTNDLAGRSVFWPAAPHLVQLTTAAQTVRPETRRYLSTVSSAVRDQLLWSNRCRLEQSTATAMAMETPITAPLSNSETTPTPIRERSRLFHTRLEGVRAVT